MINGWRNEKKNWRNNSKLMKDLTIALKLKMKKYECHSWFQEKSFYVKNSKFPSMCNYMYVGVIKL